MTKRSLRKQIKKNQFYILLRATIRLSLFFLIIFSYFFCAILKTMTTLNSTKRRWKLVKNGQFFANIMLKVFRIEVICREKIPDNEISLLVGNHVGFIDIICLLALCPGVFITSLEMKNTPGLGLITDLAGCAYVDRKKRMNIHEELKDITNVLKEGFRVVLYAESVASNGEQVLPFKKTLLMSAGFSGQPIRPFVFNFRQINGRNVSYEDRDSVCWYGEEPFLSALWRSLKLESITCEIEFFPLVYPSSSIHRAELAHQLHQMVSSRYSHFYPQMNSQQSFKEV